MVVLTSSVELSDWPVWFPFNNPGLWEIIPCDTINSDANAWFVCVCVNNETTQ